MPTREDRQGISTASDWSTGHSLGLSLVRTETPGDIVTSNNVRVGREKEREENTDSWNTSSLLFDKVHQKHYYCELIRKKLETNSA